MHYNNYLGKCASVFVHVMSLHANMVVPKDVLHPKSSDMSWFGCVGGLEGSPHTGAQCVRPVCVCELNIKKYEKDRN